jgi:hypothetical protein
MLLQLHAVTVLSAIALSTIALGAPAQGDDNFGAIRGHVALPDGTPVCGLRINARSGHDMVRRTRSKADGSYVFLGLLPGDFTIDFGTYEHITRRAHVSPMLTTTVDSPVPPAPRGYTNPKRTAAILQKCPAPSYPLYALE